MRLKFSILFLFAFLGTLLAVKGSEDLVQAPHHDVNVDFIEIDTLKKLTEKAESHVFEAEVDKIMKLIINSLYKNKEIFMRELISNASDALDKIRVLSLSNPDVLKSNTEFYIYIKCDKDRKQIIIRDSGVGMTKDELIKNLGTIARSGTSEFFQKFASSKSDKETSDLIGQFGVGFYSAFLVANKITVISKHNDDDQYIWESDANSFSINKDPRGNTLGRGTEIILHLKEEASEYLKVHVLKELAKKYSQFINFPIYIWEMEVKMVDVESEPEEKKTDSEDGVVEENTKPKEKKQKPEQFWQWAQVNTKKPIWNRPTSEISKQEYDDFFSTIALNQEEKSLAHIHFKAEGDVNFNSILYIPDRFSGDFFTVGDTRAKAHIRLYVRRVFITDELENLIPRYLSMVRGVVDSEDLPLNVSRETLQQSRVLDLIKKKLVRKLIELIQKMDKETFDKFWNKYSINLKVGIWEDKANKGRLAKLLRFKSTKTKPGELINLKDYIGRMKKDQKKIFFMNGISEENIMKSPFVERAIKMGYEVLLMPDSADHYMMSELTEFEDHPFQDLGKDGVEFHESDESKTSLEDLKKEFKDLTDWMQSTALANKVAKVEISNLLVDSPCVLVTPEGGWSSTVERMVISNSYKPSDDPNNRYQLQQRRNLQINPRHPLIKSLKMRIEQDNTDVKAKEMALLLFDTALLKSGFYVHDPSEMAARIESVMKKNLDISEDAQAEIDPNLHEVPDAEERTPEKPAKDEL